MDQIWENGSDIGIKWIKLGKIGKMDQIEKIDQVGKMDEVWKNG